MKLNVVCYRLPSVNNQPHKWHWSVTAANPKNEPVFARGEAKTKQEALQNIQTCLKTLETE